MSQSGSILLEWGISHFLSLFDWDSVLNERKLIYFIYFGWSFSQKCLKIHGIDFKRVSLKERLQLSRRLKKRITCLQSLQMICDDFKSSAWSADMQRLLSHSSYYGTEAVADQNEGSSSQGWQGGSREEISCTVWTQEALISQFNGDFLCYFKLRRERSGKLYQ